MLKKIIISVGLIAGLTTKIYKIDGVISYNKNNLYIVKDVTGHNYAFEDRRDLKVGNKVSMFIDNNNTPQDREDDLIIKVVKER